MISANKLHTKQPEQFSIDLPGLPSVIRYYDDFTDNLCSIQQPCETDIWPISVSGSLRSIDFSDFTPEFRPLIKHWCGVVLQTHVVATAHIRFYALRSVQEGDMRMLISSTPRSIRPIWKILMSRNYGVTVMTSLKSVLHHYCQFSLKEWSPQYTEFLSTLPLPAVDKYATVRRGDVFLSVEEEALLVAHFDQLSQQVVQTPGSIDNDELRATAILVCAFQFGLRPKQIGMLQLRDVRIWPEADDDYPSVHLTFKMVKQRSATKALPLPRKVKRDWGPIFLELHTRAVRAGMAATGHFFGVSSASETGVMITRLTGVLLPEPRCATELRHTAAQRLVSGANQEELAEFLGHSDIESGLVYFQTSANQAERVNKAMGISPIYQQVTKIAHDRFIGKEELAKLKGDQQIGAVPHGIPIAGIGACAVGQPSCPLNPVTACYGCHKFMPLNDLEIHRQVLADFRSVVSFFSEASGGDENSPAYLQLKRTISNVQSIIAELEGGTDE